MKHGEANSWRRRHSREAMTPNPQSPPLVNSSFAREELPLSVRDAAVYLGVSPQTVYLWVERKQIPHAQFKQEIGNGET